MKFVLTIELGNDAMQTFDDVVRAVADCAPTLSDSAEPLNAGETARVWDVNGNTVGFWEVTE